MNDVNHLWSIEEFLDCRFDLPESGQWSELIEGQLVHFQPPDLDHGNTLLNLSKTLAEYAQSAQGYACFDVGLVLRRHPDTVRFPAVSYFLDGKRFAEMDQPVTESVPALVVELASTADRRRQMPERVMGYLERGVQAVWVINPADQTLTVTLRDQADHPILLSRGDILDGGQVLNGFESPISGLFLEPVWWTRDTQE